MIEMQANRLTARQADNQTITPHEPDPDPEAPRPQQQCERKKNNDNPAIPPSFQVAILSSRQSTVSKQLPITRQAKLAVMVVSLVPLPPLHVRHLQH